LLDQKGRKNQGKTNRSARFSGLARKWFFMKGVLTINSSTLISHTFIPFRSRFHSRSGYRTKSLISGKHRSQTGAKQVKPKLNPLNPLNLSSPNTINFIFAQAYLKKH
jgi:hypothetical protein